MKLIYCLMIFLWPYVSSGQTNVPLTIGDKMPDMDFKHVINYKTSTASLSSFNDKLIIIDFWATWCSACIREFPKLDTLQIKFKDKLQVLLVNNSSGDDTKKIQSFLENHRNAAGRKYSMPVVLNELPLSRFFPHRSIPHTVWLYKGKVRAITSAEEVTASNIQSVLKGLPVNLELKEDVMDFDNSQPLLLNGNGGNESALLQRSLFTRYLKGMTSGVGRSTNIDSTVRRLYFINQGILKLYSFATPGLPANRMLLEMVNTESLVHVSDNEEWKKKNFYSYELTVPVTATRGEINTIMRQDFDRQFGLHSSLEKRVIDCYALVRMNKSDSAYTAKGKRNSNGVINNEGVQCLYNQPIGILISALNDQIPGKPLHPVVLDETGINSMVDIELPVEDIQDIPAMKNALQKYGLNLVSCKREVMMLVISKAPKDASSTTTFHY